MLSHMLRAAAKTPSVSYRNRYSSNTNATTYTFNNCDIGTANGSRLVVVQAHGQASSGTVSISSLTIAGTGATGYQNTARLYHNSLWALAVSTGTTATIVVTFSGTSLNCLIAVYALYDLNSNVPIETVPATASSTVVSTTVSAQQKGIVIAGITGSQNATTTWSGVTERYDQAVESTVRSGGDATIATTDAAYSVQATASTTGNMVLVAGSWR